MSITPGAVSVQIHDNPGSPHSTLPHHISSSCSTSLSSVSDPSTLSSDLAANLDVSSSRAAKPSDSQTSSTSMIPVISDPLNNNYDPSSLTVKPRSKSKRASSTTSESERNKFRSRLEMFSISSNSGNDGGVKDMKSDLAHSTVIEEDDDNDGCSFPSNNERNFTIRSSDGQNTINNNSHSINQYSSSSDSLNSATANPMIKNIPLTKTLTSESPEISRIREISESKISPLSPKLDLLRDNGLFDLTLGLSAKKITLSQFKELMNWHYTHPIPDCTDMFPWLHGLDSVKKVEFLNAVMNYTTVSHDNHDKLNQKNGIPKDYRGLIPVRSCSIRERSEDPEELKYHVNSGVLRGSCEVNELLHGIEFMGDRELSREVNALLVELKLNDGLAESDLVKLRDLIMKDCKKLKVLPLFKQIQLPKNISLRNFQIQVSKISQISDFIVYCFNDDHDSVLPDDPGSSCCCASATRLLYLAQLKHSTDNPDLLGSLFTTLVIDQPKLSFFETPQTSHLLNMSKILFSDCTKHEGMICSDYDMSSFANWDSNYLLKEKLEIAKMSSATKICENVWMGNSTDIEVLKVKGYHPENLASMNVSNLPLYIDPMNSTVGTTKEQLKEHGELGHLVNPARQDWKLLLNCCDGQGFPDLPTLKRLISNNTYKNEYILLNFPPSGSVGIGDCSDSDLISILNTCKLIYTKSTGKRPTLIYCSDGYTESSLLGMCYLIYVTGRPLTECLIDLHAIHGRPFFLFPTDITLISRIEDILIQNSPLNLNEFKPLEIQIPSMETIYSNLFSTKEENWCTKIHGSLPSRILSHLYLGSLQHADSLDLLEKLGITRVVSVGEEASWLERVHSTKYEASENIAVNENFVIPSDRKLKFPIKQVMTISNVQDDGIDPLTSLLPPILDFIEECYKANEKVLVHCRVGVSRSATVCIAEVMKRLNLNLIRSYFYVRVRRLNIIIQPNLRFFYELVKWEESLRILEIEKNRERKLRCKSSTLSRTFNKVDSSKMQRMKSVRYNESISSLASADSLLRSSIDLENTTSLMNQIKSSIRNGSISPIVNNAIADESLEEEEDEEDHDDDDDDDDEENVFYDGRSYKDIEDDSHSRDNNNDQEQLWLRDVDWHILCRQIDQLNKAYIRSY